MGKVRCADCGMIASVPQNIGEGGSWLSDPAICGSGGPIFKCGNCGSTNLIGISQPSNPPQGSSVTPASSTPLPSSTVSLGSTPTPILPAGFVQCPHCGKIFKNKQEAQPAAAPVQPSSSSKITCSFCHRSAPRPRIPKSYLDSLCGSIRINCDVCHHVIFEGRPQEALDKGLVELES